MAQYLCLRAYYSTENSIPLHEILSFIGSSAESVGESRANWGLCHLSLLKKTGKNSRTDLVEVWKTPIAYLQSSATLAYPNSGVAFPTTSKTLFSKACPG
jgi:hypothetical protein